MNRLQFIKSGALTLNNSPFEGMVSIVNNVPYTLNGVKLDVLDTFRSKLLISDIERDRLPNDGKRLKYSYEDLRFHANEEISSNTLNSRLNKISENTLSLYSNLHVSSASLPNSNTRAWLGNEGGKIQWRTGNTIPAGNGLIGGMSIDMSSLLGSVSFVDGSNLITISYSKDTILKFTATHTNGVPTGNTALDYITKSIGSVSFNNIVDIAVSGNFIYILESNRVIKVQYANSNKIFRSNNDLSIHAIVGGSSEYKINNATSISASNDEIAVHADRGIISIFNSNLNYEGQVNASTSNDITSISIIQEELWIAHSTGIITAISNGVERNVLNVDDIVSNESIIDISHSDIDNNIIYIVTNLRVIKYFKSNTSTSIGSFSFSKIGISSSPIWADANETWSTTSQYWANSTDINVRIKSFNINAQSNGNDIICITLSDKVLILNEPTGYDSNLVFTDLTRVRDEDIRITNDSYINSMNINEKISLIYNDILNISNSVKGRFALQYNTSNELEYVGIINFDIDKFQQPINVDNSLLHNNELITVTNFNRIIKSIISLQIDILESIQFKVVNTRFYNNEWNALIV